METRNNVPTSADWQSHESDKINNIITFNGQGRSGKTTQAKRLVEKKSGSNMETYTYVLSHALRDHFKQNFYDPHLQRSSEQLQVEVLGIPSLPWLMAYFHWKIKPLLLGSSIIVLDHYLGDYYADMLPDGDAEEFQNFVKNNLGIPHFGHGTHFYLDIDYHTYQERGKNRKGTEWFTVEPEDFEARRARYQELCDLEYLTPIDATADEDAVFKQIQSVLPSEIRATL